MRVVGCLDDDSVFFLSAHQAVLNPRIRQNLIHIGTLLRIQLQHAANDVTSLTWEQSEQSQWTLDGHLCIGIVLRARAAHWLGFRRLFIMVMMVMVMVVLASGFGCAWVPRRWFRFGAIRAAIGRLSS